MAGCDQEPTVSVVLTTHNRPEWLCEALASVLEGTFTDFEVIVSDNGDPQDTRRLQETIRDPRVRWVEQDQNLTILQHWLAAMSLARGDYVAILHDDDRWSPDFLATLVPPLERRPDAVVAFADHYIMSQAGEVDQAVTDANTKLWGRADLQEGFHRPFFSLVAHQSIPLTGSVFRREALPVEKFTPEVGSVGDLWTAYQLAKSYGAAYYSPQRLMYYRSHSTADSSSANLSTRLADVAVKTKLLADPDLSPYRSMIAGSLAFAHVSTAGSLLRLGRRQEARSHLTAALRLRLSSRAIAGWTLSWLAPKGVLARL
jgi:GT2 family glycosyltransferase